MLEARGFDTLPIRTPEGVEFRLPLGGPFARLGAWVIDVLVWLGVLIGVLSVLSLFAFLPDLMNAVQILLAFVWYFAYNIVQEWLWHGQTIGKRILGLRVVDVQGLRLQPSQVFLRNLLRPVDALPVLYGVGGIALLLTPYAQRIGDIAAATVVTRTQPHRTPDYAAVRSGKFNSFREYPHLEARLRQRLSPRYAAVLVQALLRREYLEPEARVGLYTELADICKRCAAFPEAATRGLSDEQYLRNTVDTLYRQRESRTTQARPDARDARGHEHTEAAPAASSASE